jgi:hypothetical protein
VDIRYFYQNNQHSYKHESIIDAFAKAISTIIELPELLEVCLYDLGENVYGGIDMYRINRIGINYDLPFDTIPKILAHELIHVHQKHKGTLKITRDGKCYWHGIFITNKLPDDMTYEEYTNLPWEHDAYTRQTGILSEALSYMDRKSKH